jgi:hypothetical protein
MADASSPSQTNDLPSSFGYSNGQGMGIMDLPLSQRRKMIGEKLYD